MTFKETEFFIFVLLRAGKINKPLDLDRVFTVEVLSLIKNFKGDSKNSYTALLNLDISIENKNQKQFNFEITRLILGVAFCFSI